MRRFSPSQRPIAALLRSPTPYTCSACRRALSSSPIRAEPADRTEKIRQRLWGTTEPPGLKDPYGDASVLGQTAEATSADSTEVVSKPRRNKRASDLNYIPAETADGLEWVGGYSGWWMKNWDPKHRFTGFLAAQRVTESYEAMVLLRRALVEVVALQTVGREADVSSIKGSDRTAAVQFVMSSEGPEVQFSAGESLEAFVETLQKGDETAVKENPTEAEEDVAADRSSEDPLAESKRPDYRALVESWDPSWLEIALTPSIKFAVLKRTMQLTGIRILDADVANISSAQSLLARLITPPKPRKVTEALMQNDAFEGLPNVRIYDRRVTPIDVEKQVGRWKIIEQELKRRGLPVTGRGV